MLKHSKPAQQFDEQSYTTWASKVNVDANSAPDSPFLCCFLCRHPLVVFMNLKELRKRDVSSAKSNSVEIHERFHYSIKRRNVHASECSISLSLYLKMILVKFDRAQRFEIRENSNFRHILRLFKTFFDSFSFVIHTRISYDVGTSSYVDKIKNKSEQVESNVWQWQS